MIKIITGFREGQHCIIEDWEAHKAYYLFNNPEARTTFENGVALIGKNIQGIEPAYSETMGWYPTHRITGDDWHEIRKLGVDDRLRDTLRQAREAARMAEKDISLLSKPLTEIKILALT